MSITLLADDLTGACDAGACLAGRGPVAVFLDAARVDPRSDVAAVDTDTRALPADAAARRVRAVAHAMAERLASGVVFKKIDSTLRGAVARETEALLEETGRATAVICSSFPAQGRTVSGGTLRVHGDPVHRSAIGRDPAFPGATSDVAALLRLGATRPVRHVSLAEVRGGDLAAELQRGASGLVAADAETDADLDAVAAAALDSRETVLAGSAGLARAVADRLGLGEPRVDLPRGGAWLVVAGSLHPSTRAQVRALEAAGVAGVVVSIDGETEISKLSSRLGEGRPAFLTTPDPTDSDETARARAARALASAAARLIARTRPDVVAVTGGDTARALMAALGADRLALRGAPASGLALGDVAAPDATSSTWLTKAGGFGGPDLLLALVEGRLR